MRKWSEEETQFLIDNYHIYGGIHCKNILDLNESRVRSKAHSLGLKVNKELIIERNQKISKHQRLVDADYFINAKEPEAAYILGFLWSDGYLHNPKSGHYRIVLEIIESDMLEIENMFLKSGKWTSYTRHRNNRQKQKELKTSNKDLYDFLYTHGYKNKSYLSPCSILNYLPENLRSAWFQGYFDGDGCYYVNCKNHMVNQCSMAGSYEQDWTFLENKLNELSIRYTIRRIDNKKNKNAPESKFSDVRFCKREDFIKWEKYITSCGLIGLSRKRDKANLVIRYEESL